jgi:broad specificity phosphatase PhoE
MGLFNRSQQRKVPTGRVFGRELAHSEHEGWRKLVLVRHGQTDFNVQHRLPGQLPGIPLNATGQREAQMTAVAIHALPLSAIVASPLERTLETAGYVNEGRGLEIRQDRDLLDTDYGPYNGKNWDELDKADPVWQRVTRDPTTKPPKGVESFTAVQQRAVRAAERWRQATDVGEWVALVTHADLVKMIVGHYLGIPLAYCPLINMDNASVSLLSFHPIQRNGLHFCVSIGHRQPSGFRRRRRRDNDWYQKGSRGFLLS